MAKKLNLKIPEVSGGAETLILWGMGIAAGIYILYLGGVFNGPGKLIDASEKFGSKDTRPGGDDK